MENSTILDSALRTIETEYQGLTALEKALRGPMRQPFQSAVETFAKLTGRLIVTGMGKSGHIGSKMAATFASTGTPAFFVHPAEANHGDLGMIARDDAVLAMSWSGEATELKGILAYTRRFSIPLIALTSKADSTLAKEADIGLILPRALEACPHGLAPTTSALLQLATGDALAIALLQARGFSPNDFKTFHPGGQLGANLTHIADLMHRNDELPIVRSGTSVTDAVDEISSKGFGCVFIVDANDDLVGVITDGDLRRNIEKNIANRAVDQIMSTNPTSVEPDLLASSALAIMNDLKRTVLVVTQNNKPVGLIHMHDLLRAGVV